MSSTYTSKVVTLKSKTGDQRAFVIETFFESEKLEEVKYFLLKNIDKIIEKNWGKFGKDFISRHVIKANRLKIVRFNNEIVAIASASYKRFAGSQALYLEFTVVNEAVQGYNFSVYLNGEFIVGEIIRRSIKLNFFPLHVVTITRNLRVLGAMTKFASSIYPDYRDFGANKKLPLPNGHDWKIAQDVIKDSWNPARLLEKEGHVLVGSYEDTPWLILPKAQKHYLRSLHEMGEQYLHFHSRDDREFVVVAKFNFASVVKFVFWKKNK